MNIDSFSDRLVCCLVNSNLTGSIIDDSIVITSSLVTVTPVTVNVKFIALGAAAEAVLFATSAVSGEVLRAFAVTVFQSHPSLQRCNRGCCLKRP